MGVVRGFRYNTIRDTPCDDTTDRVVLRCNDRANLTVALRIREFDRSIMAQGNENFWENVSRYPGYLLSFIFGTFYAVYEWVRPLVRKRPLFSVAVVGFLVSLFTFMYLTLEAMLGRSVV